jgi:protease-4
MKQEHGMSDEGFQTTGAAAARAPETAGSGKGESGEGPGWERSVIERLAFSALREQRTARRWGLVFRFLILGYGVVLLALSLDWSWLGRSAEPHTALVSLEGVIEARGNANAELVIDSLQAAFKDHNTAGVVLRINSPGGSPVQAGMIHDEILRLRGLHPTIPLHVVVEDVCASGGYYVASAAERVFVDRASLVGSIGVLMDGFGFTGAMDKLGVERRLLTAGANKGFLDPFSPVSPEQRAHARRMLGEIHQQFIDVVKKGRGDRLKDDPDLFSGLVWTGERSVELGLADALGTVQSVARDVVKVENVVDFTARANFAERIAKRFGASFGAALGSVFSSSVQLR